jgi:hypothetical protein
MAWHGGESSGVMAGGEMKKRAKMAAENGVAASA